jgi:hypothetical protein
MHYMVTRLALVAEHFRKTVASGTDKVIVALDLRLDLPFEDRRQDDRGGARILELPDVAEFAGEGRGEPRGKLGDRLTPARRKRPRTKH